MRQISDRKGSTMTYSLATVRRNSQPTPVVEIDNGFYALAEVAPELLQSTPGRGLMNIFESWEQRRGQLAQLADRLRKSPEKAIEPRPRDEDFMTPLQYPSKLLLAGANYYEHMHRDAKMLDFRKENSIPVFFLKAPTTSLVGCGKTVRYPRQSSKFDWEIELAVVMGKKVRDISVSEALDTVAGYAVGIDLSARDWQFHPKHPFKFDVFGGKSFDDSCPLGPKIVPAAFVDPSNLQLRLSVNGELKQNANTSDMIWTIAELIAAVSEHLTLEPGDILLTGTPAGVGLATGTYLKVGDKIDAEIDGLGRLSVEIVTGAIGSGAMACAT
jgi:2-keto-4-pentenoate hydratase/2-oxohepta-3-ene-1,7-dioic acid hydratase in catechol pathway